jgi:flagellar protein FlbT
MIFYWKKTPKYLQLFAFICFLLTAYMVLLITTKNGRNPAFFAYCNNSYKGRNPMALVIDLKPNEKILIGEAVITNDKNRTRLHISGDAQIMREKDVMQEDEATSPCKKIYFLVQCMYLARDPSLYYDKYFRLIKEIQGAAPTTAFFFMKINDMIMEGKYYKAMKEAKQLISHEKELIENVTK